MHEQRNFRIVRRETSGQGPPGRPERGGGLEGGSAGKREGGLEKRVGECSWERAKGGEAHSYSLNAAVRCVPATAGPHTALQPCLPLRSTRSGSKMAGARNTWQKEQYVNSGLVFDFAGDVRGIGGSGEKEQIKKKMMKKKKKVEK